MNKDTKMEKVKIVECSIVKVEGFMQVAAADVNGDTWTHSYVYEKGHSNSPHLERFAEMVKGNGYINTAVWDPATFPCEVFPNRPDFH